MRIKRHDNTSRSALGKPGQLGFLFLMAVLLPGRADAYIDPGTGSMIFQAALAAILGLGLVLRTLRLKLWAFLKRVIGSKDDA